MVADAPAGEPPATEPPAAEEPVVEPPPRPATPSREDFVAAYQRLAGNVTALARHYRRDRRQIYRWIATHGLRAPSR